MTLVQIGAGNIGRSFIGQLFARAGYEVVFIDVAEDVIRALNERREYIVEIKDDPPNTIPVQNVRGIDGRDRDAAAEEIARADVLGTAVGPNALPHIYPTLALGLQRRHEACRGPIDIIICENLRNASEAFAEGLSALLPNDFPVDEQVGLVETSIGKMVPIMSEEQRRADPLLVFAEAYNTLICDAKAFKNAVPDVPGLDPKLNMPAYVDRKLFVHNLGHALTAYVGFLAHPAAAYVWEVLEDAAIHDVTRAGMLESCEALLAEYPGEFTPQALEEHVDELIRRFRNRALGDTVYRVGRDLPRKLSRDDRVLGALRLDARHGVEAPRTTRCAAAALRFAAADEHGQPYPADAEFAVRLRAKGARHVLCEICGLREDDEIDTAVLALVLTEHERVSK